MLNRYKKVCIPIKRCVLVRFENIRTMISTGVQCLPEYLKEDTQWHFPISLDGLKTRLLLLAALPVVLPTSLRKLLLLAAQPTSRKKNLLLAAPPAVLATRSNFFCLFQTVPGEKSLVGNIRLQFGKSDFYIK